MPAVPLAGSAGAVATPLGLVGEVAVADPPKVPVAPLEGAVNVTVTPLNGLPLALVTVACNGVANAAFTVALCDVPAVAEMLGPASESAAPFKVTLPAPEVITHVTVSVLAAVAAEYVNV